MNKKETNDESLSKDEVDNLLSGDIKVKFEAAINEVQNMSQSKNTDAEDVSSNEKLNMFKIYRVWELYDYKNEKIDLSILYKRPRVDYRISEYVIKYINKIILKEFNIMQNENYQFELLFFNKNTVKCDSNDTNDIYEFDDEIDFVYTVKDEKNIKWHKLIRIKCYSDKLNENIKPDEYANIVYNMICAYIIKNNKNIDNNFIKDKINEMFYKILEEYKFPALFINQKYMFDERGSAIYIINGNKIDIEHEYLNYYKE